MKRAYRIAAPAVGLGLVVTAVIAGGAPGPTDHPAESPSARSASLDLLHDLPEGSAADALQEGAGEAGQEARSEGETAQEAAQYASAQAVAEIPPQWQAIDDHNNATRGPLQPIPFNHRFHSGEGEDELKIDCNYCHAGTERSVSGVVPPVEVCMGCHRIAGTGLPPIEELRGYWARNEPIPWEWVNKLPEFVQFSHRAHLRNEIECADCHGPVEEMDRVYQWAPFTMGWCLECHRSEPEETDVATDYRLVEQNPRTSTGGRQSTGMYPKDIDSQYAAQRAPTDCAACHY